MVVGRGWVDTAALLQGILAAATTTIWLRFLQVLKLRVQPFIGLRDGRDQQPVFGHTTSDYVAHHRRMVKYAASTTRRPTMWSPKGNPGGLARSSRKRRRRSHRILGLVSNNKTRINWRRRTCFQTLPDIEPRCWKPMSCELGYDGMAYVHNWAENAAKYPNFKLTAVIYLTTRSYPGRVLTGLPTGGGQQSSSTRQTGQTTGLRETRMARFALLLLGAIVAAASSISLAPTRRRAKQRSLRLGFAALTNEELFKLYNNRSDLEGWCRILR